MVIELLKVEVAEREKYLQKDRQIWTKAIAQFPGFISKEVWLNPHVPTEVVLIIRWRSREEWKSISVQVLEEIERQFALEMDSSSYKILESVEYQVAK